MVVVTGIWNGPGRGGKVMPEKRAGRAENGSSMTARRKRRKNKKGWVPGRTGKVGTAKGTAETEAGRAGRRKAGSTKAVAGAEAGTTETGACRTPGAQGGTRGETPAPWEPNREARRGGGASGACTAAASGS